MTSGFNNGNHPNETMDDYRTYHVLKLRWGLRECGKCQKARRRSEDKRVEDEGRSSDAHNSRRKDVCNNNGRKGDL